MIPLPKLPFDMDALSPYLGGETVCFIYQKILPFYQDNLAPPKKNLSFISYLTRIEDEGVAYRNACELYHHCFWFYHLKPKPYQHSNEPSAELSARLLKDFGSMEKLHAEFLKHAKHPDVRWVWLAEQNQKLSVVATITESILSLGYKPIAACNLWEHAYFLDYRDRKSDYIKAYLTHLINWTAAESSLHDNTVWAWKTNNLIHNQLIQDSPAYPK